MNTIGHNIRYQKNKILTFIIFW